MFPANEVRSSFSFCAIGPQCYPSGIGVLLLTEAVMFVYKPEESCLTTIFTRRTADTPPEVWMSTC